MRDLPSPLAIGTTVPQFLRPTMAPSALSTNVTNELNYDHSKETLLSEKALSFPAHHRSADKTKKIKLKIKFTDTFNFNILIKCIAFEFIYLIKNIII